MSGVRDIICEEYPSLLEKQEFEFDISKLEARALRKLEKFVRSKQGLNSKHHKKSPSKGSGKPQPRSNDLAPRQLTSASTSVGIANH